MTRGRSIAGPWQDGGQSEVPRLFAHWATPAIVRRTSLSSDAEGIRG
jgi:hypothetical protein